MFGPSAYLLLMKVVLVGFLFISMFLFSCQGKKENKNVTTEPISQKDTVLIINQEDSLFEEDSLIDRLVKQPLSVRADELFDDFIYNYASDSVLQLKRTVFPLPYYNNDSSIRIEKNDWKFDQLFINQEYYTLLFDYEEDMALVEDTSLHSVQFDWIWLEPYRVKRYYFEKRADNWILEAINEYDVKPEDQEDFISFFHRFSNDSVFQMERVCHPLIFVTTDPDDDFTILETTIDADQWSVFKPSLPKEKLSNINYGQENSSQSPTKILFLKGLGNGFSNTLYFKLRENKWKLYKFEDTSN